MKLGDIIGYYVTGIKLLIASVLYFISYGLITGVMAYLVGLVVPVLVFPLWALFFLAGLGVQGFIVQKLWRWE